MKPNTDRFAFLTRKEEGIFEVIGKMEVFLSLINDVREVTNTNANDDQIRYSIGKMAPFLRTYLLVTRAVALDMARHPYQNPAALHRLDSAFSHLYFLPAHQMLTRGTSPTPWETYHSFIREHDQPFVSMVLGIQSHINADLCVCIAELRYEHKRDFTRINTVLEHVIPWVMHDLAHEDHDALGYAAMLLPTLVHREFRKIVVRWRSDAWHNAAVLRERRNHAELHALVEAANQRIIEIFKSAPRHPAQFLAQLHAVRVQLCTQNPRIRNSRLRRS
jgi:hypothetical protein